MSRSAASLDAFHAIADGNRRALIDAFRGGEQPVGALARRTGLSYSLVSQHLKVLLGAGIVARRADGRQRIYRLKPEPLRVVHDWTAEYEQFWQGSLVRLRRRMDGQ